MGNVICRIVSVARNGAATQMFVKKKYGALISIIESSLKVFYVDSYIIASNMPSLTSNIFCSIIQPRGIGNNLFI